jgi:hypothetical protein
MMEVARAYDLGLGVVNDPLQGQAWRDRAQAKKPAADARKK